MSEQPETSIREVRRMDDGEYVPVCADCGAKIRPGEARAVVRQRFLICARCLYEAAKP